MQDGSFFLTLYIFCNFDYTEMEVDQQHRMLNLNSSKSPMHFINFFFVLIHSFIT